MRHETQDKTSLKRIKRWGFPNREGGRVVTVSLKFLDFFHLKKSIKKNLNEVMEKMKEGKIEK